MLEVVDQRVEVVEATRVLDLAANDRGLIREEIRALRLRYDDQLTAFAKKQIAGQVKRTYESPLLEVQFTACRQTVVDVVDPGKGIPYITKHCPEAIKHEPKVVKKRFTVGFIERVSAMSKAALARAGLSVTKPHDNVTIQLRRAE